jgi:cell division protein FtsQ
MGREAEPSDLRRALQTNSEKCLGRVMPRMLPLPSQRPALPPRASLDRRRSWLRRTLANPPRGAGLCLTILLLGSTAYYGAVLGGEWPVVVARYGTPAEMVANLLGLRVETVTMTGQRELTDAELIAAAGVTSTSSLPFLDAEAARQGLEALPLVKSAAVHKLYPDTLAITVEERRPYALWQNDGKVMIVAADGTPIDEMRDLRFARLPFVVGEAANRRAPEIVTELDKVPHLKARVRAAVLVAQRRWNLSLDNGVIVRLPEEEIGRALVALDTLETQGRVIEKDVLAIDMRLPDRVAFRLGADAMAARAEALAKKNKKGGDPA